MFLKRLDKIVAVVMGLVLCIAFFSQPSKDPAYIFVFGVFGYATVRLFTNAK